MRDFSRRRALRLSGASLVAALAGCSSTQSDSTTSSSVPTSTASTRASATVSPTEEATTAEQSTAEQTTAAANPNTVFVSADAAEGGGSGTHDDPFGSIQRGLVAAEPGTTVRLRAGEYELDAPVGTVRAGEPDAPITLTGPADAVLRPRTEMVVFNLKHSHFRLTGLTIDGLTDPTRPEALDAYGGIVLVRCGPPRDSDEYLTDISIRPSGLGHSIRPLVVVKRSRNVDVGAFEVTGAAGASYVLTGSDESHAGEFVYVGTPPSAYGTRNHPWTDIDQTNDVRVHHVDNSAGHPHSELVNTKMGTYDVLVEYCTDAGGSQNNDPYPAASAHLQSVDSTVRWCEFGGGQGHGIHVNAGAKGALDEIGGHDLTADQIGDGHRLYGNVIEGYDDQAIKYSKSSAGAQETVCGNSISGSTDGTPAESCGEGVPEGDGIGHLAGDSPWR